MYALFYSIYKIIKNRIESIYFDQSYFGVSIKNYLSINWCFVPTCIGNPDCQIQQLRRRSEGVDVCKGTPMLKSARK